MHEWTLFECVGWLAGELLCVCVLIPIHLRERCGAALTSVRPWPALMYALCMYSVHEVPHLLLPLSSVTCTNGGSRIETENVVWKKILKKGFLEGLKFSHSWLLGRPWAHGIVTALRRRGRPFIAFMFVMSHVSASVSLRENSPWLRYRCEWIGPAPFRRFLFLDSVKKKITGHPGSRVDPGSF